MKHTHIPVDALPAALIAELQRLHSEGRLVDSISLSASLRMNAGESYYSWCVHSGYGTCAHVFDKPLENAIAEAEAEAKGSGLAVKKMREKADELLSRAARLEKESAPVAA